MMSSLIDESAIEGRSPYELISLSEAAILSNVSKSCAAGFINKRYLLPYWIKDGIRVIRLGDLALHRGGMTEMAKWVLENLDEFNSAEALEGSRRYDNNESDKTSAARKYTRMLPVDFANAVDIWERGEGTLDSIALMFGVDPTNLSKRFKKVGAIKGSKVGSKQSSQPAVSIEEVMDIDAQISELRMTVAKQQIAIAQLQALVTELKNAQ